MSDREVKTRQTVESTIGTLGYKRGGVAALYFEDGWNAALASVILPEGRFEVGDRATCARVPGRIGFKPDDERLSWWSVNPDAVQAAPKTVELTVEEKVQALQTYSPLSSLDIIERMDGGKTLDQLCSEFGVSTTKELS